jgi:hypothetical protein
MSRKLTDAIATIRTERAETARALAGRPIYRGAFLASRERADAAFNVVRRETGLDGDAVYAFLRAQGIE